MSSNTGSVLGASTTVGGVALLPNTGGHTWLTVGAIVAIVGGVIVVAMQLLVASHRRSLLKK